MVAILLVRTGDIMLRGLYEVIILSFLQSTVTYSCTPMSVNNRHTQTTLTSVTQLLSVDASRHEAMNRMEPAYKHPLTVSVQPLRLCSVYIRHHREACPESNVAVPTTVLHA